MAAEKPVRLTFSRGELREMYSLTEAKIAEQRALLELEDLPASQIRLRLSERQAFSDRIREAITKAEQPETPAATDQKTL